MGAFCVLPLSNIALPFIHVPEEYTPFGQSSFSSAEHKIHLMQHIFLCKI
ncbi:hypothetical protein DWUX_1741 [Desulfovibrio diazotrophicus]|nr:hypothetical protein DWUX_1741 [Desulfovibrio diazotrophicus]VVU42941.1 hypothetical protein DWUX_287 [Desulfovibrio diazotrophicus]